jgi:hypothetical protein
MCMSCRYRTKLQKNTEIVGGMLDTTGMKIITFQTGPEPTLAGPKMHCKPTKGVTVVLT